MSTTIVTQLTGEPGVDLAYQRFAVVTVREDDAEQSLSKALSDVSQASIEHDGEVDDIELRASMTSELKAHGLQLTELRVCGWSWIGE